MHIASKPLGGAQPVDNGQDGKLYLWVIEGGTKALVPESTRGQFHSGRSYVIAYNFANGERWLLYSWQGRDASIGDKGTAAGVVMDLNLKLCQSSAMQARMEQLREALHFLWLFHGSFVVHKGDGASGTPPSDGVRMYQARWAYPDQPKDDSPRALLLGQVKETVIPVRLVECASQAHMLYTGDVYVLATPEHLYVWHGKVCDSHVRTMVAKVVKKTWAEREVEIVEEGDEPAAFWDALGGQAPYLDKPYPREPRFFACDNKMGKFKADRLFEYAQADLNEHKVAIVDTYSRVYLWIGAKSRVEDRRLGGELIKQYVAAGDKQHEEAELRFVHAGHEDLHFAHAFQCFRFAGEPGPDGGDGLIDELLAEFNVTFTYAELKEGRLNKTLPPTVDQARLEDYLDDSQFVEAFGAAKDEWLKRPQWRRLKDKKDAGLY